MKKTHQSHHHAVVLLELMSSTSPLCFRDQGGGDVVMLHVCSETSFVAALIGLDHKENIYVDRVINALVQGYVEILISFSLLASS
jgi:hypothetical protein